MGVQKCLNQPKQHHYKGMVGEQEIGQNHCSCSFDCGEKPDWGVERIKCKTTNIKGEKI